jgi:cytochrome c oxidase assembly factor CtaG
MARGRWVTSGRRSSAPVYRIGGEFDGFGHQLCIDPSTARFVDVEPMRTLAIVCFLMLLGTQRALAHETGGEEPYLAWTFDPWIVLPLAIISALYFAGAVRLWSRTGHPVTKLCHIIAYGAGCISLAIALISPLHWLGERVFTFHMIEHEIVMALAAPLIVLANPIGTLMWGMPANARRLIAAFVQHPHVRASWALVSEGRNATILHGVAIWGWHAPGLFDAAVTSIVVHRIQHLSFFVTAILFWWSVLRRSDYGVGAFHLFVTMLHTSALGALMALAPRVLYADQTLHSAEWGLTRLEDQQLAGVVMWVPAGTVYAGAALAVTALWISRASKHAVAINALEVAHLDRH